MTDLPHEAIDPLGHSLLLAMQDGHRTVTELRHAVRSDRHKVNYRLRKLEELGVIDLERFTERIQTTVDGQHRNFIRPKEATLTEQGTAYLAWSERHSSDDDRSDLRPDALGQRITDVEQRLDDLEVALSVLRRQLSDEH